MKTTRKFIIMKKVILNLSLYYLVLSVLLVSCTKEPTTTTKIVKSELPTLKRERIWQYVVAAVIVIIAETTGQKTTTTTTTTTTDGSGTHTTTTTTSECKNLGVCAGSICVKPNSGLSEGPLDVNDQSFNLHTDLRVNAKLALTQSNDIILLLEEGQNSLEEMNKFFYDDYIYFFPESYSVNNTSVLRALGLTKPFVIQGANYPVYQQGSMKFIIVGHKS